MNRHPLIKEIYIAGGVVAFYDIGIVPFACQVKVAYIRATTYPGGGDTATVQIDKVDTSGNVTNLVAVVSIAGETNHSRVDFTLASRVIVANDIIRVTLAGADIGNLGDAIIAVEVG